MHAVEKVISARAFLKRYAHGTELLPSNLYPGRALQFRIEEQVTLSGVMEEGDDVANRRIGHPTLPRKTRPP